MGRFADNVAKEVLINRREEEFLPLEIKPSTIKEAGLGVFVTEEIPSKSIIVSYLGEITTHEATKYTDSLYTLGFIRDQGLFISPTEYSNTGRYINMSDTPNCGVRIGLLNYNVNQPEMTPRYEIAVYIYTLRELKKGEEVYYNYGKNYDMKFAQDSNKSK